ncbi:MAG: sigma factor-like helix-turn-helix DNA-binding protein [Chloroflexota bacterium]
METVKRLIVEELTDRQRQAIVAVVFGGMPTDEVARPMGTNRNVLYRLMHHARQGLERRGVRRAFPLRMRSALSRGRL